MILVPSSTISHIFYVRVGGAVTAPSATPTATLIRDGVDTAVVVTVTARPDGGWLAQATIPAGWLTGQMVGLAVSASVTGYIDPVVESFEIGAVMTLADMQGGASALTPEQIAQAIVNAGTPIKVISSLLGSKLEMYTHETLKFDVLGIIPADVDNVIFTVKLRATDSDADALIQVDSTTGLLVINQVAAAAATEGSVTVDQPNGKASIVVSDDAMATLGAYLRNEVCWNAKWITATGESGSIKRGTGTIPHSITQAI